MLIKVFTMNSFAKTQGGGNPAAIVLDANDLTDNEMQKLAEKIGFSETAFITKSKCADFKVRFFTPVEEVDLCGHATVGAFYLMAERGILMPGNYSQETRAGVLNVEVMDDHLIMMDQALPCFYEVVDKAEIADSLNLRIEDLAEDIFPQIVSTGMRDIMVPIRSLEILNRTVPDMVKVAKMSRKYNTIGYHLFTLETLGGTAHCRNLAPLYGIPEESACGTANGALSSYLTHHGRLSIDQAKNIVMEQGYTMEMPSEILASVEMDDGEIIRVRVGGKAIDIKELEVEL
ncbi:PhzF family phenazine biosynthesis protein [Sinanaerobacter sp. ZZT-01]|uniref:PhzF family phenazine biosynthesis protein n=1 Tax=Sinanaerobacter sp. ZZT-01 TaxID=3111540 RepID=UPI002D7834A8|nr:PhzF family phenazine biosynthesis protein [Sinanaerobacter sp. ZZT-01]WRR93815.1 PhzF family phenazine biosynthesis protein [Sinanaerobacter sp. ZZT-01]